MRRLLQVKHLDIFQTNLQNHYPIIPQDKIQSIARAIGFDACGVSRANALTNETNQLQDWLRKDMHGDMGYMERNFEKRTDPTKLVPGSKSVVSVLLNYYPGNPDISTISPKVSRYALSTDYHNVVKEMLYSFLGKVREEFGPVKGRAFVDSAPVLDRAWAVKAGLGWIGKNSMFINPKLGTYTFIGELIIDLDIEPSKSIIPNRCGTCTRCIDACPTGAIVSPGVVDSRKCISYINIEKKGALSEIERNNLNGWCFGCDICQEVCPWNAKLKVSTLPKIQPKDKLLKIDKHTLRNLTAEEYNNLFEETPVTRAGYKKFSECCKL